MSRGFCCYIGATDDHLFQYLLNLVHLEDEVELEHFLKALIQRLDEHLDLVEDSELRLILVHDKHE